MANTILTPDIIAKEALMVLRNNAVMANLVYRDYSNDFVAGVGDTVTIRKPATFEAKEFSGNIEIQDANESGVPVVMDKLLDVSFAVTTKELTMDIESFSTQLLVPAMQAFADKVDKYLIALETDITNRVAHASGAFAPTDIISARKYLTDSAAPTTERRLVVGSQADADLLTNELFVSAEKVGDKVLHYVKLLSAANSDLIFTPTKMWKRPRTDMFPPSLSTKMRLRWLQDRLLFLTVLQRLLFKTMTASVCVWFTVTILTLRQILSR